MSSGDIPQPVANQDGPPPPASAPPAQPAYPGYPAYPVYPVSGYPAAAQPVSGYPVSAYPVSGYPVSGYPYPVSGYPVAPMVPVAPRRSRWQLVVNLVAVFVIVVAGLVAVGYEQVAGGSYATWVRGEGVGDPPPGAFESDKVWTDWARRSVSLSLEFQASSLLKGDEKGYLAAADPDNAALVADLGNRFEVLHAMAPGVWKQAITGGFAANGSRRWRADIRTSYCFGPPTCSTVQLVASSEWGVKGNRVVLTKLGTTEKKWNGPRPWETDLLTIATGDRVIMGAAKSSAWRLTDGIEYADRAAKVADQFAQWDDPPSRYVAFFAGPNEWSKWYGDAQPEWAAAWAVPVSSVVTEVVVRARGVRQVDLEFLLTHEFTHVATLAGKRDGADAKAWWLIEGVADYAAMLKTPVADYDALEPTGSFVRNNWDGNPAVMPPGASSSDADAAARYGVAFLAVRRLAEKYTQAKMLSFFGRVVHDGHTAEQAAPAALGKPWSTVRADVTSYIRSVV